MKNYSMDKLIKESGFKNFNEVASYLLSEFNNTDNYGDRLEIMQFAKNNNIDIIGLVTGEKTVEFYTEPVMSQEEIKTNIQEITKEADIVPPVDEKVKEILD